MGSCNTKNVTIMQCTSRKFPNQCLGMFFLYYSRKKWLWYVSLLFIVVFTGNINYAVMVHKNLLIHKTAIICVIRITVLSLDDIKLLHNFEEKTCYIETHFWGDIFDLHQPYFAWMNRQMRPKPSSQKAAS